MPKLKEAPFCVLIDSNESHPFSFHGMKADAADGGGVIAVPTERVNLGRYPDSLGDYSVKGLTGQVAIERKSMEDVWGTVLGWESPYERSKSLAGRRQRFEKELENLSKIPYGVVVVEATLGDCLRLMPGWGRKPAKTCAKIFSRSIIAYTQDHRVPWLWCDSRRHAEKTAFRWLWRAWQRAGDHE